VRPLRADAQRNRAKVLTAAKEAFAAEGIAVPLDEIARRAGVGAGTVYRHFPTKEALFEAVIVDRLSQLVEQARSLATAEDPGAAFFEFLHRMISGADHHRDLVDALSGVDFDLAGATATGKQDLQEAGETLLRQAQRAGAVREDVGMREVMTLLTGATMALRHHEGDAGLRGAVFAVLRDGLRARWPAG
jgi:AcrR family transcriptional regulator